METSDVVRKLDGTSISMDSLDSEFDTWVHTDRKTVITHCAPDSAMGNQMKLIDKVYPITRYVRGRILLLSSGRYQALGLLKNIFTQMNYIIKIETEKSAEEIQSIITEEARNVDNHYVDSLVVMIYGTPDNIRCDSIQSLLNDENAPFLKGKPKLLYFIGDDSIVNQVHELYKTNNDPDILSVSTGFNAVMFYIYILCTFAHELSAQDIWRLMLQNAQAHRYKASTYCTMTKDFYFFPGLTSSVFPDEVEKMDPMDMQLYKNMLEHGEVKTYNIRLMFVGLFGAGKTSTVRRILEEEINGVTSTDGIDVHTSRCRIDIRNRKWRKIQGKIGNVPKERLRELHFADEKYQSLIPDIKSLDTSIEHTATSKVETLSEDDLEAEYLAGPSNRYRTSSKRSRSEYDSDDETCSLESSQSSVTKQFQNLGVQSLSSSFASTSAESEFEVVIDDMADSTGSESMKRARDVLESKSVNNEGIKHEEAVVSLWDFAGQFVYYATHQLFFSPRCIYLLVLNLEEDLEKTLSDWYLDIRGKESIETKGGINFWLRSILTYTEGSPSGIPPILLIGTHADKLKGNESERKKVANDYISKIRNMFQGSSRSNNLRQEYFILDNTRKDDEIDRLKDTILSLAQTMPYWGETTPAKWLDLEQAIDDRRKQVKLPFITLSQLKQINDSLESPIGGETQMLLFLKTHHDTGSIIYFGDSNKLKNFVILEPQWIVNAFRSLIGATEFGKKYGPLQNKWEKFNNTGELTEDLAKEIWSLDTENKFYENSKMLLDFLEKLNIIAKASVLAEDGITVKYLDHYFVPCMLKKCPPENLLHKETRSNAFSTPVLCLDFCEGFMPPSIFYRVVALCIGKWPLARNGKLILMFCGCAVFEVNFGKGESLHRLYIFTRKSKIGLRITRYTSNKVGMVDPSICDRVRRFVTSAVKSEFRRFRTLANEQERKHFKYQLQCKETNEDDILDEGLHNEEDLLKAINTDFFCAEHSERTDPHALKPVGMLHEWFYEKIPENIRLEDHRVFETWIQRLPEDLKNAKVTEKTMSELTIAIGNDWKLLMKILGVKEVELDRIEMNNTGSKRLQKFYGLYKWRTECSNTGKSISNGTLLEALRQAATKGLDVDFEEVQDVFDNLQKRFS